MALGQFQVIKQDQEILFRDELLLEATETNKESVRTNLEALGQTLQNLLIIHKGTYPNDPDLGVGISDYLFELSDQTELTMIESAINDQIERYVAHPNVHIDVHVGMYDGNQSKYINSLIVQVDVQPSTIVNLGVVQTIAILLSFNKINSKLVSTLYTTE